MKEEKYTIKGAQVFDNVNGDSYNLTSKHDAEKLYIKLNIYEEKLELYENITRRIEELSLNLIEAQMSIIKLEKNIDDLKKGDKQ